MVPGLAAQRQSFSSNHGSPRLTAVRTARLLSIDHIDRVHSARWDWQNRRSDGTIVVLDVSPVFARVSPDLKRAVRILGPHEAPSAASLGQRGLSAETHSQATHKAHFTRNVEEG
ncbi:unnamed protein product [Cercospora beticola]|nr:unnamed protein product [Cercospora beticola]